MENTVSDTYLAITLVNNARHMGFTVTSLVSADKSVTIQNDLTKSEWNFKSASEGHAFLEGVSFGRRCGNNGPLDKPKTAN